MLGLIYLAGIMAYLIIIALVVWLISWIAKKNGGTSQLWTMITVVVLLGLVLWDWPLMEIMFRHNCSTQAGFTINKTLEQWKDENPGIADTLHPTDGAPSTKVGNTTTYSLNQRFNWEITQISHWFHIRKQDERIVDKKTGEILAQYIDFNTDIPPLGLGIKRKGAYKIWMMKGACEQVGNNLPKRRFNEFSHLIKYQEEIKL